MTYICVLFTTFVFIAMDSLAVGYDSANIFYNTHNVCSSMTSAYDTRLSALEASSSAEMIDGVFNKWISIQQLLITILGIILLVIPLLTYLFGYRPMKKAESRLKQIEANFEAIVRERFNNYINDRSIKEMESAIECVLSDDPSQQAHGRNIIYANKHILLSDGVVHRIYNTLCDNNSSNANLDALRLILACNKSPWSQLYFNDLMTDEDQAKKHVGYIASYLNMYSYNELQKRITSMFSTSTNKREMFQTYLIWLSSVSPHILNSILNDDNIIGMLSIDDVAYLWRSYNRFRQNNTSLMNDTLLDKAYENIPIENRAE